MQRARDETMSTKYIFLDVDGTLVNFEGHISPSTVKALKTAQKNGHKIIIATGRQKSQIYPELIEAVDFDGLLCCCGAYLEYQGKEIFSSYCSPEKLSFIIDFFHENDIYYCLQTKDALYVEKDDLEKIRRFMVERGSTPELIESVIGNAVITESPKAHINIEKLAYYHSPYGIKETSKILGDYFKVVTYSLGKAPNGKNETYYGEVNFDGITKASGIEKFMEIVSAPLCDTIAFGDSGNDLEMIEFANIGVAMGNASDDVKAVANLVTTDVNNDGIYNAFVKLGII